MTVMTKIFSKNKNFELLELSNVKNDIIVQVGIKEESFSKNEKVLRGLHGGS